MSGAAQPLASQSVEFTLKGLDIVKAAMDQVRGGLGLIEQQTKTLNQATDGVLRGLANRLIDAKGSAMALRAALESGAYQQFAQQLAQVNREVEKLGKQAAWEDQVAKLGKFRAYLMAAHERVTALASGLTDLARSAMQRATSAAANLAERVQATPAAIGAAVAGFQMLTSAVRGWVNAGLAGTAQGNLLAAQFQLMSREIASVFVPTIQLVTRGIQALTDWFRNLTGPQQRMIEHFVQAAGVIVLVNQGLGRLSGAVLSFAQATVGGMVSAAGAILTTLVPAIGTLVTSIVTGSGIASAALGVATAGISVLVGLAGAAVSALVSLGLAGATMGAGIAVGTSAGRSALGGLLDSLRPLAQALAQLGSRLQQSLAPVLAQLGDSFGGIITRLAGVVVSLSQRAAPVLEQLVAMLGRAGGAVARMVDGLDVGALEDLGRAVLDAFAASLPVVEAMGGAVLELGRAFGDLVKFALPGVVAVAETLGRWQLALAPAAEVVWRIVTAFVRLGAQIGGVLMGGMLANLRTAFETTFGNAGNLVASLTEGLRSIAEWISTSLPAAVEGFVHALGSAITSMLPLLQRLALAINQIGGAMVTARMITQEQFEGMDRIVARSLQTVREVGDALRGFHVELSRQATERARGTARDADKQRTDVVRAGGGMEQAMDLWRRLQEAAVKNDTGQRQVDLLTGIKDGIERVGDAILNQPRERAPVPLPGQSPGQGRGGVKPPGL